MIGGWLFCGLYLAYPVWWFLAIMLGVFTFVAAASSFYFTGKEAMYPPMVVAAFVGEGAGGRRRLGTARRGMQPPWLLVRHLCAAPPQDLTRCAAARPTVCVGFATPQAAVSATVTKTVGIAGGILVRTPPGQGCA